MILHLKRFLILQMGKFVKVSLMLNGKQEYKWTILIGNLRILIYHKWPQQRNPY